MGSLQAHERRINESQEKNIELAFQIKLEVSTKLDVQWANPQTKGMSVALLDEDMKDKVVHEVVNPVKIDVMLRF